MQVRSPTLALLKLDKLAFPALGRPQFPAGGKRHRHGVSATVETHAMDYAYAGRNASKVV